LTYLRAKQPPKYVKHRLLLTLFVIATLTTQSQQVDSNYLRALYDRCIDMDESKADSVEYYAEYIAQEAEQLHFNKKDVLSIRLHGIAEDLRGNYEKALVYYLQSLEAAKKLGELSYELSALNDLAYIYVNTKQPVKAKEMYLACASLASKSGNIHSVVNSYVNLGGIYNLLGEPDSSLYFLNQGLAIAKKYDHEVDASSLYNNIGNVYFKKKEFTKALPYFQRNYIYHLKLNDPGDLWLDELNLADVYIEMRRFDSAHWYAQQSLNIARSLQARSKESDSYAILSKLYSRKNDYRTAYEYQQKWYTIDTSLVNESTNRTIANLQERFNAKQREQDNKLLQAQVEKAYLKTRTITYLAIAAVITAVVIAISLIQKRMANKRLKEQNDLIKRQNEKLAELNYEKNSLISIVSHDLGSPFAAIRMWSQVLQSANVNFTEEQKTAVERISQSTAKGEALIHTILDVEKAETNQHKVELENFDLKVFVESIVGDFRHVASDKNIQVHFETADKHVYLVSDKHLVGRICENLFSNAIKYTPPGKNVWVSLSDNNDAVSIKVKDEGVGIDKSELPHLFSKYSQISSRPTNGEASTGLGLSIVKRIVQELNGSVFCESEPGKGSLFTIVLRK
jgi:signal transduction histidine kinase